MTDHMDERNTGRHALPHDKDTRPLVRIISTSDIDRCPKHSLLAGHYRDDGSCECTDPTEAARREMIATGQPQVDHTQTPDPAWNTAELQRDFEVFDFLAPFVMVKRKSDGKVGTLEFTHSPRVYFNWQEDTKLCVTPPRTGCSARTAMWRWTTPAISAWPCGRAPPGWIPESIKTGSCALT
jgi:hypothetical protein